MFSSVSNVVTEEKQKKITNDLVHICYKRLASGDPFDNIINMNFP